jgi:hypothetical protein
MSFDPTPTNVIVQGAGGATSTFYLQALYAAITASTHWQIDNFSGTLGANGLTISPIVLPTHGNFQIAFRNLGTIIGVRSSGAADITDATDPLNGTKLKPEEDIAAAQMKDRYVFSEWADALTWVPWNFVAKTFEIGIHAGIVYQPIDEYNATLNNRGLAVLQGDFALRNGTTDIMGTASSSTWSWVEESDGNWRVVANANAINTVAAGGVDVDGNTVSAPIVIRVGAVAASSRIIGTMKYLRGFTVASTGSLVRDLTNSKDYMVMDDSTSGYLLHPVTAGFNPGL